MQQNEDYPTASGTKDQRNATILDLTPNNMINPEIKYIINTIPMIHAIHASGAPEVAIEIFLQYSSNRQLHRNMRPQGQLRLK